MKNKTKNILLIPLALLGALFYRMRGGLRPHLPRPIDQILVNSFPAIFLPLIPLLELRGTEHFIYWCVGYAVMLIATVAMECSGNGGTMDLGYSKHEPDGTTPETTRTLESWEWIIYKPLYKKLPRYWYDVVGTTLRGFLTTLPAGVFLVVIGNPIAGICMALSGCIGGLAYMISWKVGWMTEGGEYMTGGGRWLLAALIWRFFL